MRDILRYGIIADIHSNLEALQSVLAALRERGVDEYICAGDIVGYGADPGACIKKIREVCQVIVGGNHDHAAVDLLDTEYFNPEAKKAVLWTRRQLNEEEKTFLKGLKLTAVRDGFLVVHGTPLVPKEWNYINSTFDAYRNFKAFEEKICFVGHSHSPVIFTLNTREHLCEHTSDAKIPIFDEYRYIVNVGSVGQPRDGNPMASFAVYDTSLRQVEIVRVEYDIKSARRKIVEAGRPEGLALRLVAGI